jgi:hypothetical protein
MKAVLATNDIRDLEMHRNNGVTALAETRDLLGIDSSVNGTG